MARETVCVVGLGYVGLPLACRCAEKGYHVNGFDSDLRKIRLLSKGISPIKDSALESKVKRLHGRMFFSGSPKEAISGADIIVVCVPTPTIKNKPDLKPLKGACKTVGKNFSAEKKPLVVIESTVYPGTVREVVQPILEKGGLREGKDFLLAYCPERIDPGNSKWDIGKIPRVFGAMGKEGLQKGLRFYNSIVLGGVAGLSSVEAAEAVKVFENSFRDINIAFVNEVARCFDRLGIDMSEVIRGAGTKPFGFMPFYPGPGVGGHCIAEDPYYLIAKASSAGVNMRFMRLAREINNSMPNFVVGIVARELGKKGVKLKGAKIAVLGVAYKADVDDVRNSPALKIIELLRRKKALLRVFDPFLPKYSNVASLEKAVKGSDCILLATHHSFFAKRLSPAFIRRSAAKAVVDARNALDKEAMLSAGVAYKGVGR